MKPLVILAGPTAVGKTALSVALAKRINGAVISADSMQIYRYMDIGSAKIMPEEMQGVPHYMIGELDPWEEFHVARFAAMAKKYLEEIYAAGKIPILTGGTGFYIQALRCDIDFTEQESDEAYRKELETLAEEQGAGTLHQMLRDIDPDSAEAIHANNIKRTIRALEYHRLTGERISEHNRREKQKSSPYLSAYFVLTDRREELYRRIDRRVDRMVEQGLVEEVARLKKMGCSREMVSMQGLGYKEILSFLEGERSLEEAVYIIKRETRRFAKRQITWFKRERDAIWLDKSAYAYQEERILSEILPILTEKGIISRKE